MNQYCNALFVAILYLAAPLLSVAADNTATTNTLEENLSNSSNPTAIIATNKHGLDRTFSTAGFIDFGNAFLKNLVQMTGLVLHVMRQWKVGQLHQRV